MMYPTADGLTRTHVYYNAATGKTYINGRLVKDGPPPGHSAHGSQSRRPRRVPYPDAALIRRRQGRVG